jgi:PAS domain S-box-containing protein
LKFVPDLLNEIFSISHAITENGDPDSVQQLIVDKACSLTGAAAAALVLTDEEGAGQLRAAAGPLRIALEGDRSIKPRALGRKALPLGFEPCDYLEAPVEARHQTIGSLQAWWKEPGLRTDQAPLLLSTLAAQASVALECASNHRQRTSVEERFRNMVAEVRDYAIFMLDADGNVASWNAGAKRIKGYKAEEIIGRHFSRFYTLEDRRAHKPEMKLAQAVKEGRAEDEGWRVRKDGSCFIASVVITALRDDRGQLVGFTKVTRDITDRKRSEEEKLKLVREQEARAQAERALTARDQFLALVSHELRNPIGAISNALYVLDRLEGRSEPVARHHAILARQVGQLSKLVNGLFDISRISSGKGRLDLRPIDALSAVKRTIQGFAPEIKTRAHDVEVSHTGGSLFVNADPNCFEQMIQNLLQNAIKYTPNLGRIRVELAQDKKDVIISVTDNGIGIAPEVLSELFMPFAPGDGPARRSRDGIGLGLTIVKCYAEQHNGSIKASSEGPNRGSKFVLKLPRSFAIKTEDGEPHLGLPGSGCRLVLADDDADGRESLRDLLELLGHTVTTANDGPGAVAAISRDRPAAAIIDLNMPGFDGYEVARRVRAEPWSATMLLIAITGHCFNSDRERSRLAGFDVHLSKPVNVDKLRKLIDGGVLKLRAEARLDGRSAPDSGN